MRNLVLFIGCILYIVFVACKKDKQIIEEPEEEPDESYSNLNVMPFKLAALVLLPVSV